ncbi:transcriptional regulator [Jannaschia pagri]|uniref:Transcriptional regulator n=1 Tax=Jannaschia pagri TaxID=2829797 RepID=A0ABQ4NLG3_9RHOB|nr:LysR family transcriptional regulator [Jannaschia sp. AI_62]GIT95176.1 transcriptional regulator [Jannaschia sp. AI_62]
MNYAQMSAFEAVMTSATLTDAAVKLGRTQPAVTAAIKSLEAQLGMPLFERQGRKLVPVPEAQYLLAEVSEILSRMAGVRSTIHALADGKGGRLNVAAMPGPISLLFPRFLADQIGTASGIKVALFARSSSQIAELARAQTIDFGFTDLPQRTTGDRLYHSQHISGDCFVALPRSHPLADRSSIDLSALDGHPMGSLQANHVHLHDVREAFDRAEAAFDCRVESQTFLPLLQFVMAEQCCAIIDPLTVAHINQTTETSERLVVRPLSRAIRYRYAIIWPKHRPASIIATHMRTAWMQEICSLLTEVDAAPRVDGLV